MTPTVYIVTKRAFGSEHESIVYGSTSLAHIKEFVLSNYNKHRLLPFDSFIHGVGQLVPIDDPFATCNSMYVKIDMY